MSGAPAKPWRMLCGMGATRPKTSVIPLTLFPTLTLSGAVQIMRPATPTNHL